VQVKDGAFLSSDAWQALGGSASALLSAGTTLAYIGPVFALFGYAIKQWSTCQEVPQEAVDLLQPCRDLLFDLNEAWPHIALKPEQQQQEGGQKERLQRWLMVLAAAAADCVVIHENKPLMRWAGLDTCKVMLKTARLQLSVDRHLLFLCYVRNC
jgi:hypothetical protein